MPSARVSVAGSSRRKLETSLSSRNLSNDKIAPSRRSNHRKGSLGLAHTVLHEVIPRKKQILASRIQAVALCTILLVLLAFLSVRHKRGYPRNQPRLPIKNGPRVPGLRPAFNYDALRKAAFSQTTQSQNERNYARPPIAQSVSVHVEKRADRPDLESQHHSENVAGIGTIAKQQVSGETGEQNTLPTELASLATIPEQIEWYSRPDMVNGTRPTCRVSNACILNNNGSGIVSLPSWMAREDFLLRKCGVGPRKYHASVDGLSKGVSHIQLVEADLVQQIFLSKFKEPPSSMTEHFTSTVLRAAYQLELFSDGSHLASKGVGRYCYASESGSNCIQNGNRKNSGVLRPAIITPAKNSQSSDIWETRVLSLLMLAYGQGSMSTLTTADLMSPSADSYLAHQRASNISAMCFRSIIFSNANFNELPDRVFDAVSTRLFSSNGVDRAHRKGTGQRGACSISIAIMKKSGHRALRNVDALKEKIEETSKAALPDTSVTVNVLSPGRNVPFKDQVDSIRDTDILVGGTSHSLSNMAFMRTGSAVFEVFPFAWQPETFLYLATALGIKHIPVFADPQSTEFNDCIEHEVLQMRKQQKLDEGEDLLEWVTSVESRWRQAVVDFTLTGSSSLFLNSDKTSVSNFHTRLCARQQSLDFNVEATARAVVLQARNLCHSEQL
jgi:hypothetical protein